MDFATIIGIVLAIVSVSFAAYVGEVDPKLIFGRYEAFILVFGGTLGATMVSFPLKTFTRGIVQGAKIAFTEPQHQEAEMIATLVSFAEKARREGLLALENEAAALEDEFLRKGIQLVIDGRDTDIIRKILETEAYYIHERDGKIEAIWMTLGGFAPTLGIIGTVLGLIAMLKGLATFAGSDNIAGKLGIATAQAFVATFFGIALANLFFIPISSKIKERSAAATLQKEIMIEGILSIQAGDNPRLLEEKLHAFLSDEERHSGIEAGGEAAGVAAGAGA